MPTYSPAPIALAAGPLTLLFDNGMIRRVCFGEVEIVRRVYMALRDEFWNTIPYTLSGLTVRRDDRSFSLGFDADHRSAGIHFRWRGAITGSTSGEITLTMRGTAATGFHRGRIGWCVLHPLTLCKDAPCTVGHADGSTETTRFPGGAISPRQLFFDVRSLSYPVDEGHHCILRFSGDLFETEDQRNWTDASFKTYGTPLALPAPVWLEAGTVIEPSVSVSLSGPAVRPVSSPVTETVIDLQHSFAQCGRPVSIGLGMRQSECTPAVAARIRLLGPRYLRFEIDPAAGVPGEFIGAAAGVCNEAGCAAELALRISREWPDELQTVARAAGENRFAACRFALLPEDGSVTLLEMILDARRILAPKFPDAVFIAGSSRYFVEINRNRPSPGSVNGLCFSATPQVHTSDDAAIMENLEGFAECVRYARTLSEGKPVAVSPLTLRPQFDPRRPKKYGGPDERQRHLFAAAWLTGALAAATAERLDYLTGFGAVSGPEGIMSDDGNELYPLYHILSSGICSAEYTAAQLTGKFGPSIAVISWFTDAVQWLLAANLSDSPQAIRLKGLLPGSAVAILDETTLVAASCDPQFWEHCRTLIDHVPVDGYRLTLRPYAVARVRIGAK